MKITLNTCQLSFKSRIIDVHAHVGRHIDTVYTKDMLDTFVKQPLPNNDTVELMIVSDTDTFKGNAVNEYEGNKRALQSFGDDKSYTFLVSCCPQKGNVADIERLMQEFPGRFVGLKFHPNDIALPVTDDKYKPYFEFANKNKIPCMFHTQVPVDSEKGEFFKLPDGSIKIDPYGDPEVIYGVAKKYKDAPFILAHMGAGWNDSHERAINVLVDSVKNQDANLYADISWVDIDAKAAPNAPSPKDHIVKAIKRLKGIGEPDWKYGDQSYRLMFGTDAPISRFGEEGARSSYAKFVDEIKIAIRSDKDLAKDAEQIIENLFYNNAKKLFGVTPTVETVAQTTQAAAQTAKKAGGKAGKIIAGVAAAVVAIGGCAMVKKNNSQNVSEK